MISQTQTTSNQYGFYAVPKKLQPKKKYRQSEYQNIYDNSQQQRDAFQPLEGEKTVQSTIQRDFYVDEAPYPQFKPKQRGLDYGVQIEQGDLFDFDVEVNPLLQILIGRSVVLAINELQEQKQIIQKRQKLETYQKKRNAELMVTQRLQAKNKRKIQESQRRVLQKQLYVKAQKQAAKKVIARKSAKSGLLGLKYQVLVQLQQSGYLRSQSYTDLRIDYQGWLYGHIVSLIRQQAQIRQTVCKMVNEVEGQKEEEHKKKIQKEKKRRQDILDERQRLRRLNQQRKQRKRIRKQRRALNEQRQPGANRFYEALEKYQSLDSILHHQNTSNGFISSITQQNQPVIHISGGLLNYIAIILNSAKKQYTAQEIQEILIKVIAESHAPIQVELQKQEHTQLVNAQIKKMQEKPADFMNSKRHRLEELKQKISISQRIFQLTKTNLKPKIQDSIVQTILNILLTTTEAQPVQQPVEGQQAKQHIIYQPTQKDKQRQQLKPKLILSHNSSEKFSQIKSVLRIRFERKYTSEQEQNNQLAPQSQPQQAASTYQWVDIYDGLGWQRHCKEYPEEQPKEDKKPVAITGISQEQSYVVDQITMHYLQLEIEQLTGLNADEVEVKKYKDGLLSINGQIKLDIPIYDGEIKFQQ